MPASKKPRVAPGTDNSDTAPARPLSMKERLAAKAKQKAPSTSKKAKARDTIVIGDKPETKVYGDAADRMLAAVHAKKAIEGHEKAARAILLPFVQRLRFHDWVAAGSRLDNPKVLTPSGSNFILQCKDTLSGVRGFRVPKGEDGQPIPIEDHLKANGVPDSLISRLKAEGEFKEDLVLTVNMARLEKEHPELAERLMGLIVAANEGGVTDKNGKKFKFSDDEMESLLERNNDVTLKEDFLDRAVSHCKATATDDDDAAKRLESLLTAIKPQWAVGSAFCANPDEGIVRLLHEEPTAAPPPDAAPTEHKTPDGKYTIKQIGTQLTVIRNSDGKQVAQKACKDAMHAANTVRKWCREPASLSAYIAENA